VKGALDRAVEIGADAVQLFTQSPRTWRAPAPNPDAYARFREQRQELGVGSVLCHALYLINLAAPDDTIYEKSVTSLASTVDVACAIQADGVVFHVGSHLGAGMDAGVERVEAALRTVLDHCSDTTWLLMENSAGAGGTIGRSVDELALLYERLEGHPHLGICLDSCHLYVSGCDVTDRAALDAVLDDVDQRIGLDRLRALHVNDAKSPLGSNSDRHDNILDGLIGEQLGVFVGHPALQGVPAVLEVPGKDGHGPDAEQVTKLRELHARWTT
jgi:deoxyribonuclease-4